MGCTKLLDKKLRSQSERLGHQEQARVATACSCAGELEEKLEAFRLLLEHRDAQVLLLEPNLNLGSVGVANTESVCVGSGAD